MNRAMPTVSLSPAVTEWLCGLRVIGPSAVSERGELGATACDGLVGGEMVRRIIVTCSGQKGWPELTPKLAAVMLPPYTPSRKRCA